MAEASEAGSADAPLVGRDEKGAGGFGVGAGVQDGSVVVAVTHADGLDEGVAAGDCHSTLLYCAHVEQAWVMKPALLTAASEICAHRAKASSEKPPWRSKHAGNQS